MTGRRGLSLKKGTVKDKGLGYGTTVEKVNGPFGLEEDRDSRKRNRGRRPGPPTKILPNVDVHGIIFVVLVLAFVVWPAAQWALDL